MKQSFFGCHLRWGFRWALLTVLLVSLSAASFAGVFISVRIGPPPLPVYAQPICPGPGFIWTPGYWAWNDINGYYWVPGTWVMAPVGMLWTPGYWGWGGGVYMWHPGYWGPHVGFYGGINYGFGYTGVGFAGGEWRGRNFYYNRSVTNVSVTNVTNVYNKTVIVNNTTVRNVSYNGGTGGVQARASAQEETFAREHHQLALPVQDQHEHSAMENRQNFASENHGRPGIAATARPGDFGSRSVVAARAAGGEYHAPAMSPREARVNSGNFNNRGNDMNRGNTNRSNDGFRPFTPPSKTGTANGGPRGNPTNNNPHGNSMGNHDQGRSQNEYKPQGQPHPVQHEGGPSHSSPPPREMKPAPPRHEGPQPKEEHHH